MCSVSSVWGSGLVIGTVWGGECGAGDGSVCVIVGVGVFRGAGGLDKVGAKFGSAKLIGQVLCGGSDRLEGGKRLRLHVPIAAVVMLESRVARCVHCVEDVA